ncbi:MAG: type II toxin-antitoxin system Phd/YefM family antitoxin [Burkholderiales bacterium]|nr:type II toxin-antitoxin system Phd/YefM family antitoxin [Burkholderiales bacterium]
MKIAAAKFKSQCLALMDEVARKRKEVVITKRGRPVAKLVPVESDTNELFGGMRGTGRVTGDIVAPIRVRWNAAR